MYGDTTLNDQLEPVQQYLRHPAVTDLVVNEPGQIGIRINGEWQWIDIPSFDFDTLDAMSILIGQRMGREFDEGHAYCNSTLPEGQRFQGVRPPGTRDGHVLWAVRRPPAKARQFDDPDFEDLTSEVNSMRAKRQNKAVHLASHFRNKEWREFFKRARLLGLTIGFCGAMGDGKSDMVRRAIQIYRPHVRMVTLETDDEMGTTGPKNKAPIYYDDTVMTSDEAVRITKRMVPNEVVMQEVRGSEAWSLFTMLNSGITGLTTWHSEEGREFEALCDMAHGHPSAMGMKQEDLMERARSAFDIIAFCRRNDEGKFRISSVRMTAAEKELA